MEHAYLIKEVAMPHPGAHKHSVQYDGKPDWRFGVRVGTWNMSRYSGMAREICEELRKRMIGVHCLQEVR